MTVFDDCGLSYLHENDNFSRSTTIIEWIWTQVRLSVSPQKASDLFTCEFPSTVHGLCSFTRAYKMLYHVLPIFEHAIATIKGAISSRQTKDKIKWSEELIEHCNIAQSKQIPRRVDHLWIIIDGSVSKCGIRATLYIMHDYKNLSLDSSVPS